MKQEKFGKGKNDPGMSWRAISHGVSARFPRDIADFYIDGATSYKVLKVRRFAKLATAADAVR